MISSRSKDCAKAAARLDAATIPRPVASTRRSPMRFTNAPACAEAINRTKAKALTTAPARNADTPNARANTGSACATIPKPSATQNAITASTATSRGSPLSIGVAQPTPRAVGLVGASPAEGIPPRWEYPQRTHPFTSSSAGW